jgi:hypothetical protein
LHQKADIEHALRHVREIGGNSAVRALLTDALGHRTTHMKRELRAIGMGCGDDHAATRIEITLAEEGILPTIQ